MSFNHNDNCITLNADTDALIKKRLERREGFLHPPEAMMMGGERCVFVKHYSPSFAIAPACVGIINSIP